MKRIFKALAVIIAIPLILTSCAQSGSKVSGTSSSTSKAANTTFTMWGFVAVHADFFKDATTTWNTNHPDEKITLNITTMPGTDLSNKLQVALQSGVGAPDFVNIEVGTFANFLKGTPKLVDLSSLIKQDKNNFTQAKLNMYSKNGKLYGLDYQTGTTVAYYNTDILSQAGVDYTTIKTWDDFISAGKQVKEKTGKYMWYISQSQDRELQLMTGQLGADYFDSKTGKVTIYNKSVVNALQLLHDMIWVDKIAAVAPGGLTDTEECYGPIDKGNVASVIMPIYYNTRFTNYMPDLKGKVAIAAPPVFAKGNKNKTIVAGGTGTAITDQCKNIDLAKRFLAEAKTSKDACIKEWTILGDDPLRTDVWSTVSQKYMDPSNKFVAYFKNGKDIFNVLDSLKNGITNITLTPDSSSLQNLLYNDVQYDLYVKNSGNADSLLKSAANEISQGQ